MEHLLKNNERELVKKYLNIDIGENGMEVDDIIQLYLDQNKHGSRTESIYAAGVVCIRCRGTRIFYREIQLRSSDEGASVQYKCETCSNVWLHR